MQGQADKLAGRALIPEAGKYHSMSSQYFVRFEALERRYLLECRFQKQPACGWQGLHPDLRERLRRPSKHNLHDNRRAWRRAWCLRIEPD